MPISSAASFHRRFLLAGVVISLIGGPLEITQAQPGQPSSSDSPLLRQAQQALAAANFGGGVMLHVGCGTGEFTAALHKAAADAGPGRLTLGIDRDAAVLQQARDKHRTYPHYGKFSFAAWPAGHLPMVDNSVNLLVLEASAEVNPAEVQRVLTPNGHCVRRTADGAKPVATKARPESIDDWTHYLHDASGNAVAHDDVVGPPRRLQWLGLPRWSRHHDRMASMSALVSSAGRLYYIMDEGSRVSIQLPAKWTLIARDAFNGVELWRQPISNWQSHLWPLKSGPTQLARRLVATEEHVFVTLAFEAPLTQIDAATGEILQTYEGTKSTEEVLHVDGMLLAQVNEGPSPLSGYSPEFNVGDQRRVASEFVWNGGPRWLKAIDVSTGKTLWSRKTPMAPLSLSANEDVAVFHTGQQLVCLDRRTGEERWQVAASRRDAIANHFGPKIVIYENVVLYTGGDRNLRAYDAKSGLELWSAPKPPSAYQSPEDLLVVGGLVWTAPTTSGRDTGVFVGRDPRSGEVKKEFAPNVDTYWFHHRCYIAKATDKYIIPSRTGIEFVDYQKEDWDIHHWVRGGCLYGVLPANGLLYAPPHNCACYPEAKLYGFNAMAPAAPAGSRVVPREPDNPLTRGPAFGQVESSEALPHDWPTFRHDNLRSGGTDATIGNQLQTAWTVNLGGRLTAPVAAGGKVYVAQIDQHTLHALDADDGASAWTFTTGGRIDSPPTIAWGHVVFGSTDGHVYCLRAADGELVWRLQAAPDQQRLMVFGQLESVWPVHGSVLVDDGVAYFVSGRSNFLDGGLWWFKVDLPTGAILSRQRITDIDPTNGADLQDRLQILQMPVGLPDILSTDGRRIYMRSQVFDLEGNREDIGPISGQTTKHASVQQGETAHLFAPMGFLDGTWFHRSYWVYGRNFAGGHNGYYQAGRFAPSGRILVSDKDRVYGFGRKPQYLRWTTVLEHQLFSANKIQESPPESAISGRRGGSARSNAPMVRIALAKHLDPTKRPITLAAWVKAERPGGVIAARGGPQDGFAIHLDAGKPVFTVRRANAIHQARGQKRITGRWSHVAGVLDEEHLTLYLNGEQVAQIKSPGLLAANPKQPMEIGADDGGAVGRYQSPAALTGAVDDVRLYHAALNAEAILQLAAGESPEAQPQLHLSFDSGDGSDSSPQRHHGQLQNAKTGPGKFGRAVLLTGPRRRPGGNSQQKNSFVKHNWTLDLPMFARAMTLTADHLVICGPPDVMDEEETFQQLVQRDEQVEQVLAKQQQALEGKLGGQLLIVSKEQGVKQDSVPLPALPVWDGMIATQGRIILCNVKGQVQCIQGSAAK